MMNSWNNLESYNVIYTVPAQSDRSAMPLGNGELCASVWMTEDGVLRLYLARTDALTENDRTVKLGMVELSTAPGFLSQGGFRQTLLLREGRILLESNLGEITVFVAADSHTLYITGDFQKPLPCRARFHSWRDKPKTDAHSPWITGAVENADVVKLGHEILIYHQNGENGILPLAALEGVSNTAEVPDFLTNRIFGGVMRLSDSALEGDSLTTTGNRFSLTLATESGQYPEEKVFEAALLAATPRPAPEAMAAATAYWKAFWETSYAFISGDIPAQARCTEEVRKRAKEPMEVNSTPSQITRGYLLTKFMIACCKEGNFPIFYNGFLSNLCPGNGEHLEISTFSGTFTSQPTAPPSLALSPDERSWSIEHLWQNLRLPYYTMLHTGDFSSLKKMFRYYLRFQGLNRQRAKRYYNADGQHNTEMTLSCGLQSAGIYGVDRTGKSPGHCDNSWGGSIEISPGLELLNLMLDYCAYTGDREFLEHELLSYAHGIFDYIATRFPKRREGKIFLEDINCIETFFHTNDPTPIIAGMLATLQKLLKMGLQEGETQYFSTLLSLTPALPTTEKAGKKVLLPAREYEEDSKNVESAELYAVYPFGLFAAPLGGDTLGLDSFLENTLPSPLMQPHTIGIPPGAPCYSGWQYIGNAAAMLGLTDTAAEILRQNAALQNPGNRFPAMWGPVYDAVPDSDHGANLMNLLQLMLMQCYGDKIYLLPAFPKNWNASFRFHAPKNTLISCTYQHGKLEQVTVTPEARWGDVVVMPDFTG